LIQPLWKTVRRFVKKLGIKPPSDQIRFVAQSCPTLCDPMNLILCRPLLLLPSIPPSSRVFSNDPAIPLLGIYPEETRVEKDTCISFFIATLFTIARTTRCPPTDKKKLWYIYTMEYYSAIKRNAFESVLMRWVKLEPIIQSEVSQKGRPGVLRFMGSQRVGHD